MTLTLSRNSIGICTEATAITPRYGGPPKPKPERRFIAWDGEGVNINGPGRPQSYVLFGCSTGDRLISKSHLPTTDLLRFIIDVGRRYPRAHHVGFAFNYDANMLIRSLPERLLLQMHKEGFCYLRDGEWTYYLEFRPGKWFQVSRWPADKSRKGKSLRTTVRIEDVFSFFACSFIKAYEKLIGTAPAIVTSGKARRKEFSIDELDTIEEYWRVEIGMLEELAESLRSNLYSAGLKVSSWYGPGVLANYTMRQHSVKSSMANTPPGVSTAARYAYAGGRFELFRMGRALGPLYSIDINSAYPDAIRQLPNLAEGEWDWVDRPPRSLREFGVWHVRYHAPAAKGYFTAPGPFFHRDKLGLISFPPKLEGWYWGPEVWTARNLPGVDIVGGWIFRRSKSIQELSQDSPTGSSAPFAWIADMYNQRMEWKREGNASQLALKLCMNSLYGKMAQRIGWNEQKRTAPTWHQLEWAGWVTSYTRAKLYRAMVDILRCDERGLIAVETDGIYTTVRPELLGIEASEELGGWSVDVYDEIIYVQSGLAWLRKNGEWEDKRRGLDADSFTLDDARGYVASLLPRKREWPAFEGKSTRFVGLGAAIASSIPTKVRHCVWATAPKHISVGAVGKRGHRAGDCQSCRDGLNAYEGMHDLGIRTNALGAPHSYPHPIPWLDEEIPPQWYDDIDEDGEVHYG